MNALDILAGLDWWFVAGWTMLHFLWLGALVGLAAGACRLVLRRASAHVRYAAALVCLTVLAALPLAIGVWVGAKPQAMPLAGSFVNVTPVETTPSAPGSAGGLIGTLGEEPLVSAVPIVSPELAIVPITNANPRQSRGLADVFASAAEFLPWTWLLGTPLTFVLLATGFVGAERLRRTSRVIHDGPIAEACARLVEALGIGRRVTIAVCERIAAPVLVGIVRPIILLPPAALTGWSPDEIEMVLLHELAHVRRWDNLINLLQRMIESLLFFHPAVWLVSNWVRREREACCDAVVVGRTNRPHAYAEMLVALAAQMPRSVLFHPAASSAMAAGPLRGRIRRILHLEDDPMLVSGKSLVIVMSGLLLVATLVVLNLPAHGEAKENGESTIEAEQPADTSGLVDELLAEVPDNAQLFVVSDDNPLETRTYEISPKRKAELPATLDAMKKPPFGLHTRFEYEWDSTNSSLQIRAARAAQNDFFAGYIRAFNAGLIGPPRASGDPWPDPKLVELLRARELGIDRAATQNNLKDLLLALLTFNDAKQAFPAVANFDANGKPLLSWRVHLLPYLGEEALYREFHLDEPWDSEHNRKLVAEMPKVFKNPRLDRQGFTNYLAVVGRECMFDGTANGIRLSQVSDGTANTLALVEADADLAVEWTKPQDWEFDRAHPTAGLGGLWSDHWFGFRVDGSSCRVSNHESPNKVGIQFTRAGGETKSLSESAGQRGLDGSELGIGAAKPAPQPADEFRSKFIPSDTNRYETRVYEITDAPNTKLQLDWIVEMLKRDPSEPKPVLGYNWTNDWTRLEIIAPTEGQEAVRLWILAAQSPAALTLTAEQSQSTNAQSASEDWPKGVVFPSPMEGEISRRAWQELGIKVVPATKTEVTSLGGRPIKVVGGVPMPPGTPAARGPMFLVSVGENEAKDFDDLATALQKVKDKEMKLVKCVVTDQQGLQHWILVAAGPPSTPVTTELADPTQSHKFPSLEDQKLADLAWKRLGLELAPIGKEDLKRVRALGYDGGLRVTGRTDRAIGQPLETGNILVGLHVWPMTSLRDVATVLQRDDLSELSPLKYYIVRPDGDARMMKGPLPDKIETGRISVSLSEKRPRTDSIDDALPAAPESAAIQWPAPAAIAPQSPAPSAIAAPFLVPQPGPAGLPVPAIPNAVSPRDIAYAEPATAAAPAPPTWPSSPAPAVQWPPEPVAIAPQPTYGAQEQPPATASTDGKPTLRYNGKTFDEWQAAWKTELSTERRLEAVKALAAFGASGMGQESTEAILGMVEQLDWQSIDDSPAGRLKQACVDALTTGQTTGGYRIPANDWLPPVVRQLKSSPGSSSIGNYVIQQTPPGNVDLIPLLLSLGDDKQLLDLSLAGLKAVDPRLEDERVRARFGQALTQGSPRDLVRRIAFLQYPETSTYGATVARLILIPGFESMLFHPNKDVRQTARIFLSAISPEDEHAVVGRLLSAVDSPSRSNEDRLDAIRALAAMGKHAKSAEPRLKEIAHDPNDAGRFAAAVALERMWPEVSNWDSESKFTELFGTLGKNSEDLKNLRRNLETEELEILPPNAASNQGGGVF